MPDSIPRIESISPSKYERLKSCALQVFLENQVQGHGRKWVASKPQLIGLVFHKAFELYLSNSKLDSESAWQLAVSTISKEYKTEIQSGEVRRPKLFFEKRIDEVLGLLDALNAKRGTDSVKAEFRCSTNDGRISGVIDLFVDSETPVIVDFKTGVSVELEAIAPSISRQLSLYAAIISDIRGLTPRVYVMGMKSGPREIVDIDIDAVLGEVHDLVANFNEGNRTSKSNVSSATCTYCRQVGRCEDVWKQVDVARHFGFVAGRLESFLIARNGLAYVQILLNNGIVVSVRDMPSNRVAGLTVGLPIKIWGLRSLSGEADSFYWVTNRSVISDAMGS
jgi:phage tail protein X